MPGQITPPVPGSQLQGPILSVFEPQANILVGLTNAANAVATTATPHGYSTGFDVRLDVPLKYSMGQALYVQTIITVIGDTTFTTLVDTTGLNAFVVPSFPPPNTPAQVIPITGETRNIAGGNGP